MPPNPPQQPQKPGAARFFKRVSSADPLAGSALNNQNQYAPPAGNKFDFILNDKQGAPRRFGLPFGKLPRLVSLIIVAVVVILLIVIGSSLLGKKSSVPTQDLEAIAAQQQEIIRVSGVAQSLLQQAQTINLDATTTTAITSEQKQLISYLSLNHVKIPDSVLNGDVNQSIDTQLNNARQSNSADQAYSSYLKQQLNTYQALINAAYPKAGPNGKVLLQDSYNSTSVLLQGL